MNPEAQYRYPGVAPFSMAQQAIFFGRSAEIARLVTLITNEQQVLLYAKSGLGKSSLINAGLLPHLAQQENTVILQVRIGAYQGPQSPTPLAVMHAALPPVPSTFLDRLIAQEGSLWQHFKAVTLTNKTPLRFYLIFDQFEELFTHPQEAIFAFKKQMADLLYRVVPKHFRAVLEIKQRQQWDILSDTDLRNLNQSMDLHVLYAIREDRYSHLNRLADHLPDILHTRLQLGPLTRTNAEEAIVRPASIPEGFVSQAFQYSKGALQAILDYLTKEQQQPVETTQLQILCSRLEQLQQPEIQQEDIPAFDDIFLEFYYECIQGLPAHIRDDAQAFIEEELIKSGQRIALDRLACLEYLDAESLDSLLRDRHLLRAEHNSTGGTSLELSHDTLIAPVLRARVVREARQEEVRRVAEEQKLRDKLLLEKKERIKAKRDLRKIKFALYSATIGGIVALVFFLFALYQRQQALMNEEIALVAKEAAIAAERRAIQLKEIAIQRLCDYEASEKRRVDQEITEWIILAKAQKRFQEPKIAISYLENALRLDPRRDDVRTLIQLWGGETNIKIQEPLYIINIRDSRTFLMDQFF